jgi:DNA-binding NarL/FixJ family response regulator
VPLRCLLVDDNAPFLDAASVLLQRDGMTVVGVAMSGADALRLARALRPDVVLVDIGLGNENGFDVARLLDEDDEGNHSKVILISARAESDYSELIVDSPAIGFVAKSELSAGEIDRVMRYAT